MVRSVLVIVITAGLFGAGGAARADKLYGGVGFGGFARVDGKLAERMDPSDQVGGRIVAGLRSDNVSVEGVFFGTDFVDRFDGSTGSTFSLGVDVKLHVPLMLSLEGYVRGGINTTAIGQTTLADYSGRGWDYGAGLEYRIAGGRQLPLEATAWLDWNRQVMALHGPEGGLSGRITMINVGFSLRGGF